MNQMQPTPAEGYQLAAATMSHATQPYDHASVDYFPVANLALAKPGDPAPAIVSATNASMFDAKFDELLKAMFQR